MSQQTEDAIRLLTQFARGDVALVRSALVKHERDGVDAVMDYIERRLQQREEHIRAEPQAASGSP